jgi:hypothetical protein
MTFPCRHCGFGEIQAIEHFPLVLDRHHESPTTFADPA